MFQQFNLLSRTSALENVELPTVYAGISPEERTKRAMESLTRVGLADRAGHHPSQLSGGQQQRVAIARGLVNRPSILLADEPTGNLDSRTSVEIMDILQTLNDEQGLTIVLVTHEPDIAQYSKRTLEFRDGKLAPRHPGSRSFWSPAKFFERFPRRRSRPPRMRKIMPVRKDWRRRMRPQ